MFTQTVEINPRSVPSSLICFICAITVVPVMDLIEEVVTRQVQGISPHHYFRVVVGEGDSGGRNIMITKKAVDFKVTARDVKDQSKQFTMTVY